ncbi:unnamed protein product [Euphydryas editha]|uniref:Uncharacterized protein n=1 Tax=Euphydryas editha TaxID=104508 RepID=A0AAU9UWM5_EUPED|nr:unnamed protein product [Euphydryas editha]
MAKNHNSSFRSSVVNKTKGRVERRSQGAGNRPAPDPPVGDRDVPHRGFRFHERRSARLREALAEEAEVLKPEKKACIYEDLRPERHGHRGAPDYRRDEGRGLFPRAGPREEHSRGENGPGNSPH